MMTSSPPLNKLGVQQPPRKWVPRPLVTVCGVCDSPAADVQHYGAITCYSCRAFFRRTIIKKLEYKTCSRKTDQCEVDIVNRTNCKKCRYLKCFQIGMNPNKVESVTKKNKSKKEESFSDEISIDILNSQHQCSSVITTCSGQENQSVPASCSEESNTDPPFDIGDLVEQCFMEEIMYIPGVATVSNVNAIIPSVFTISEPILELTFEEEFKIHELLVRKDNLLDRIHDVSLGSPGILKAIEDCFINGVSDYLGGIAFVQLVGMQKLVFSNLCLGGSIRQAINMFDEYKNVNEDIKTETIGYGLRTISMLNRSLMMANKDKETLIKQQVASGTFTKTTERVWDMFCPNNRNNVKSVDPGSLRRFDWSTASPGQKEFYFLTLNHLGQTVKDDVKLGSLFSTLILATPGAGLSLNARHDPALHLVQKEISLLMFRYLRNKTGDSGLANRTTNTLLKLVEDLHTCIEINKICRGIGNVKIQSMI